MARQAKPPEERRHEIVTSARKLFFSRGFARTTITEIIEEVGVSKGLFYYYFGSKEEILDEIVIQLVGENISALEELAQKSDLPANLLIMEMLAQHQTLVADADSRIKGQLRGVDDPEIVIRVIRQTVTCVAPIFTGVVERGIAQGIFHIDQPSECVKMLLFAYTFEAVFGNASDRTASGEAFYLILERSLGAQPGTFLPRRS